MKIGFFIIGLSLNCLIALGQKKSSIGDGVYIMVPNSGGMHVKKSDSSKYLRYDDQTLFDLRKGTPQQVQRVKDKERLNRLEEDRFWGISSLAFKFPFPRQSIALRFEKNTGAKIYQGNNWKWGTLYRNTILISGKSDVEVIDGLISPATAKNYRYRIIQNDNKELIGWKMPTVFKKTSDNSSSYCELGKIEYKENQFIFIEIYNIHNYKDRDAIIIDWRTPRPLKFWASVDYRKKSFGRSLLSGSLGNDRRSTNNNFIATDTLNDVKFILGDSLVRIGFHSQNLPTPYNYQVSLKRSVGDSDELVELGETNGSFYLYKEYWNKPGKYEVTFTPRLNSIGGRKIDYLKDKEVAYKFTVLPMLNPEFNFSRKEFVLIAIVACVIFGTILGLSMTYLKRKNLKRLNFAKQQKELSRTQLNSIRAQLNPHFMFNALAGIQNLMNTDKIDEANRYLGKFSRLTRNVLDGKELISLAEEKTLLEDYLQMEQFRFGFNYRLIVDEQLALDNIEIPSMLLQPFVENAVKHGISHMGNAGEIAIYFTKQDQNLVLKVKDNGVGFETDQNYTGLGLQLSKNRISLLNTIYPETEFLLTLDSSEMGSEITITLTQWL
ncbi:histidine kinase [Pedobacter sp. Du54]|uniref:sensor histidine kinase n=1 Tax=Pedobacter anseongensis TaxID=3133439 RepID=UPI0030A8F18A